MDVAVLGTGQVGRTIAGRLDELGHHVVMGTRDPEAPRSRGGDYADWSGAHPAVDLATFADAAASSELVGALGTPMFNYRIVR